MRCEFLMTIMLRIFGISVGVVIFVYGLAVMDGALVGTGPCRANCGLYASMIRLFGQEKYNVVMGFLWAASGIGFVLASTRLRGAGRVQRKRRQKRSKSDRCK